MTLAEPRKSARILRRTGTLKGYALFHLNMMFSSIEEEQRSEVIRRCYDPLLDLAEHGAPLGVEASGLTLEIVNRLAPDWIARLKQLIAAGRVEFVGSGYAQAIGPLMPWRAVAKNLELGRQTYAALLGVAPRLALVNEQAWSGGLPRLYRDAGYEAVVMDWDDCAAHHPEWNRHWRYHPQRARGVDGAEIGLLWSNTVAFQKLQRLAHGDITLEDYVDYALGQRGPVDRMLALYTNDAECFDFRPGRFATEEAHANEEWKTIGHAFAALARRGVDILLPSQALESAHGANANHLLTLEAPTNPTPVKKQPKYNLTRWACTGRDDLWANTMCRRAYEALAGAEASPEDWRELCRLWSSDFRTHITERRWAAFVADLTAFVARVERPAAPRAPRPPSIQPAVERDGRHILIETPSMRIAFDARRGLAVRAMGRPNERALIGFLPHGTIDDIALSADWYTGNAVFEGPGEPKVTDLERCEPQIGFDVEEGALALSTEIATPLGPIRKKIVIDPDRPRIDTTVRFDWPHWGKGSLRLGHVTLMPDAFDPAALRYAAHNGGRDAERFRLADEHVDLGAPVSFLISCRSGLGMTEGWLEIADDANCVRLEADMSAATVIGLVEHKVVQGQTFCRMMLSALELDETRRARPGRSPAHEIRYAISLDRINGC